MKIISTSVVYLLGVPRVKIWVQRGEGSKFQVEAVGENEFEAIVNALWSLRISGERKPEPELVEFQPGKPMTCLVWERGEDHDPSVGEDECSIMTAFARAIALLIDLSVKQQ